MRMLKTRLTPVVVLLMLLASALPIADFEALEEEVIVKQAPANLETYNLYLGEESGTGGDGSITTIEPEGSQLEASALSGVDFHSDDLISDLTVYGQGSANQIELYIFIQFRGSEGSTADLTFTLNAVGGDTYTETKQLSQPCNNGLIGNDCSWVLVDLYFEVPEDGFTIDKGAQLRLQIDGSASCEGQGGQGGIGSGGECDVLVAYNKMQSGGSFSRLSLKANALADSSVKVHAPGGIWTDAEQLEWSPNHREEFRTIQFSVDVRNAFGRDDINSVNLVLYTPSGTDDEFTKEMDDDLRLDNNGLVGNYTWTYDAGIDPGTYDLRLEITDVQNHVVEFQHVGLEFLEYGMYLSLPLSQPDTMLIAPGQVSTVEFLVEHTGDASIPMDVEFDLYTPLPASWSEAIWDQPGGYSLAGGGSSRVATLSIETPEDDLSTAPERIEVWARGFVENEDNVLEEVVVEKIVLDVEEVGVFAPPRLDVFKQNSDDVLVQIADSNRPDAFDETISHYIDTEASQSGESFYIDLFNAGFDTDSYRLKVENAPSSSWSYSFHQGNDTVGLPTEGPYAITPEIGSHEISSLRLDIFPPTNRDDVDIGLFEIICFSTGDDQLYSSVSFTVHRTFGILAQVVSDSDGQEIGKVGPVDPGSEVTYVVEITDSTETAGVNTWRVISPGKLDKNTNEDTGNPVYGAWDYSITDDSGADVVAIQLSSGEKDDIEVKIKMRDQVLAGNHTLFLRVTEEVSEGDPRYFDLPLKIEVKKEVLPGRIFVERVTELTPFLPNAEQSYEFRVENANNIEMQVIISTETLPSGWSAGFTTSGSNQQGNTILLTIEAFETSEFTMILTAPEDLVPGDEPVVVLSVEPVDDEISNSQLKQSPQFKFTTSCEGLDCLINAALNFDSPQVIGLYVGIILIIFLAVYRRGQNSARETAFYEKEDATFESVGMELEDIPDVVTSEDDFDMEDDLELLDDLEDI